MIAIGLVGEYVAQIYEERKAVRCTLFRDCESPGSKCFRQGNCPGHPGTDLAPPQETPGARPYDRKTALTGLIRAFCGCAAS